MELITKLLLLFVLVPISGAIIRNEITDRCLHLRSYETMKHSRKLPVYGRACSWDIPKRGMSSNKNEHAEIVASSETLQGSQPKYNIRRVSVADDLKNYEKTCLTSLDGKPDVTSSCDLSMSNFDPKSIFSIDLVPQSTFKGSLSSAISFKIINDAGDCLTVKPGSELLLFRKCSPRYGLFQVWSVCRHNRHCDVDLTWTPRNIHFSQNGSNETLQPTREGDMKGKFLVSNSQSIMNAPNQCVPSPPSDAIGVTNEVLYTIQNALRIYSNSEAFLSSSLDAFYPKEVLTDAAKLLQGFCSSDQLQCQVCMNRQPDMPDVVFLIKWMTDCNNGKFKKRFLSKDILHVLLSLFPSQDSFLRRMSTDNNEKIRMVIPALKKYLSALEAKFTEDEIPFIHERQETQTREGGHNQSGDWEPPLPKRMDQTNKYEMPLILDIDIRLEKTQNLTKYV